MSGVKEAAAAGQGMHVDQSRPTLIEPLREHVEMVWRDFAPDLGKPRRRLDRVPIDRYAIVFLAVLDTVNR